LFFFIFPYVCLVFSMSFPYVNVSFIVFYYLFSRIFLFGQSMS
jgi:hypothetical protein